MNVRSFCRRANRVSTACAAFLLLFQLPSIRGNAGKYESIVTRNPFGLKDETPPPPKVEETPKPPAPVPLFILTGLTKLKGTEKAYLVDPAGKSYDEKYFVLSPGTQVGDLTLVGVDFAHRSVRLEYQGREIMLSMKENDMTSFLSKPRIGGEPVSIAYANIRQRRIPRSTIFAALPVPQVSKHVIPRSPQENRSL